MTDYTFSEARQKFASLLERARREGAVRVKRRDGQVFLIQPERRRRSPLVQRRPRVRRRARSEGASLRLATEERPRGRPGPFLSSRAAPEAPHSDDMHSAIRALWFLLHPLRRHARAVSPENR